MNDRTITVSNGGDFYRIPLSDLGEAYADGFYVPAFHGRTIVTNGSELFEIPLDDVEEARADGFRDILASENRLLGQAEEYLGTRLRPVDAAANDVFNESSDTAVTNWEARIEQLAEAEAIENDGEIAAATVQETSASESRFASLKSWLGSGDNWKVLVANTALHGLILLVLAMLTLPAQDMEIVLEISSVFEAEENPEAELDEIDIESIDHKDDQPMEMAVVEQMEIESPPSPSIDINDLPLNSPSVPGETGPPSGNPTGKMGGRSKAGRAAMAAKRGGTAESEAAVAEALNWMARHQCPDGGWSFNHVVDDCNGQCSDPGELAEDCRNAATGLVLLAMLGAGHTPFEGDFKNEVRRGMTFLLQNAKVVPEGLDMRGNHAIATGMYVQAIGVTALCEMISMLEQEQKASVYDRSKKMANRARVNMINQLRPAALSGIQFIVNSQNKQTGGWGYDPGQPGDTSILGWQMMALKSAAYANIAVPATTIRDANRFLDSVQTSDYWYGYIDRSEKRISTTAIGVIARMLSGMKRDHPSLEQGVEHISSHGPDRGNMYYNYYATQVMLHYGGSKWRKWNEEMRDHLVETQIKQGHAVGSWDVRDTHGYRGGRLYMTSLCTMTLEVYYRHLPLYGEPAEFEPEKASTTLKSPTRW